MTLISKPSDEQTALRADQAFRWLRDSGIQVRSDDAQKDGGICSWYDVKQRSYPFIYAEITGYAINAFLFQHQQSGDGAYLSAALRAGDWLLANRDTATGLVRTRLWLNDVHDAYFEDSFFVFDQWVIVYGLASLAKVSSHDRFLRAAVSIADFLLSRTVRPDGFFEPLYDSAQKRANSFGDKWSRQPGSFHAKALMSLALLFQITQTPSYRDAAEKLLTKTLEIQLEDGRFITQDNERSTHLHPFLYTLEGLASYAISQSRADIWPAVERGMKWILDKQNGDGSLYCFFRDGGFQASVRVDTLAQSIRVATVLLSRGFLTGYAERLEKLRTKMESFQLLGGPQAGGFLYGEEETGAEHEHVNAWVTMFAGQALRIHDEYRRSGTPYDMSLFI